MTNTLNEVNTYPGTPPKVLLDDPHRRSINDLAATVRQTFVANAERRSRRGITDTPDDLRVEAHAKELMEAEIRAIKIARAATEYGAAYDADIVGTDEYRDAWTARMTGRHNQRQRGVLRFGEFRDLSAGTGSAGGFAVPKSFYDQLLVSTKWAGAMRSVCTVIDTSPNGRELDWPTTDATGGAASILGENVTATFSTADPVFAQEKLFAWQYIAPAIRYPVSLDNDSPLDIGARLAAVGGLRLALGEEPHMATGSGSGQPLGAFTATVTGKTSGSASVPAWTDLVDLYYSVNASYRQNATWMFNSATAKLIGELEATDGKQLFDAAFGVNRILDRPVVINDFAPDWSAGNNAVLFGDFKRGYIARTAGVVSIPLIERYMDSLELGCIIAERFDGTVGDIDALRVITVHS